MNENGKFKWRYDCAGDIDSSPAIGVDGTIYVGTDNAWLHAFNCDGTLKWRYGVGEGIESSPAIDSDGTIYVGNYAADLHAVYSSSSGLADTPWPMFRQNLRHTGAVPESDYICPIDYDLSGDWEYTISNHWDTCPDGADHLENGTYSAEIIQTEDEIELILDGNSLTGTIVGDTITLLGNFPADDGTLSYHVTVAHDSASTGSGAVTWSWSNGLYTCQGGENLSVKKEKEDPIDDGDQDGGDGGCFISNLFYGK